MDHSMSHPDLTAQRLVAAFFLGWLLFNYPLLTLFDRAATLFDIPLIFIYLFGVWALLIVLMAFLVEHNSQRREDNPDAAPSSSLKE
jgi:predicted permease